jgi:hypothetical protein
MFIILSLFLVHLLKQPGISGNQNDCGTPRGNYFPFAQHTFYTRQQCTAIGLSPGLSLCLSPGVL